MGIEELNFSSAVLQGSAFSALADLVADLAAQKDLSNKIGLTYTEMQNLVKSFGLQTMTSLGRNGKVDASGHFLWTLPLSEVQKLSVPVVIGSDIVRDIFAAKDKNLASGDEHFIEGLAKSYVDISVNKAKKTNGQVVNDLSQALGSGYEFPRGLKLDAIDWFDLSAVVKAKNIRFDSRSEVTDISAIYSLFHEADKYDSLAIRALNTNANSQSGDRLNDANEAKVQGSTNTYGDLATTDLSFNQRDRDYLNFLNLFVPTPGYKDVSNCGVSTIAPYLEAGLFKSNVGYGLNKEYLTTASAMKNIIRNNVRGTNSDRGANLINEFQILKDYGFTKAKVYEAYAGELTYGVNAATGVAYDGVTAAAATYSTTKQDSPEDIQTQFASVFGSSGGLADQLNEFQTMPTFNDVSGGIALAQLKAASDVKSWVEYINKVKDFVNGDQDHHWSETGIAFPINNPGSVRERWENFQEVLAVDPRLSHLPNLTLTSGQDERLRILLETIANADVSAGVAGQTPAGTDLSFSSWTQNDMTLAIHCDVSNSSTYIKDGDFYEASTGIKRDTPSIWAAAVKHGWSDATEVYGNLKGSGIFMMDSQYNVRSRVRELDRQESFTKLDQTVRNQWLPSKEPTWLRKNVTDLNLDSGSRYVYEYFTPGHFQDAFFDMTNLQHTANVALRYFDLETQTTIADDVSKNVTNIDSVVSYSLPLRTMDTVVNSEDANNKYASTIQHNRIGWVWNELVKKSFNTTKAAVAEITSWRPVPPALYVDTSDVTGYVNITKRQADANKAGDYVYNANQAKYDNRNLPGAMVHVMANFFAKASSHNSNSDAELIALLDLHPVETLRAFNRMSSGQDLSSGTFANLETAIGVYNTMSSSHDSDQMIERMLKALVHYGKPASHFSKIGASAKLAINAYESEVNDWASDMGNTMGVFGDDADVFSMVQHLGYWVPYLSQYTPEEIAEEAATDDDIQNISDKARAFMLGLLLAATRGTLASSRPGDAAARLAGLNAFHAAGIPRTLVDIAYTLRGINIFANLSGSNYDQ